MSHVEMTEVEEGQGLKTEEVDVIENSDFTFDIGIIPSEKINLIFMRSVMAEFIATFLFLYLTVSEIVFRGHAGGVMNTTTVLDAAWTFGISIMILVYVFAGISGANINPAVSLACLITKKISLVRFVCYVIAQCLGATCGACLAGSYHITFKGTAYNFLQDDVSSGVAFCAEVMGTGILVLVVMGAVDTERSTKVIHLGGLAPIAIGFTVYILHLSMIFIDNCSINPARSFGAAVAFNYWENHWIFWVGPFVGAIISALFYEIFFKSRSVWEAKYE